MSPNGLLSVLAAVWLAAAPYAQASEPLVALARPVVADSSIADFGTDVQVRLKVTQPVLWRVFTLSDPMRLVLEFGEVDWSGVDLGAVLDSDAVQAVTYGYGEPGWSRLVLELSEPLQVETAGMTTALEDGSAVLKLQLTPTDAKSFNGQVRKMGPAEQAVPTPEPTSDDGQPMVVLDPGHGGIDPGAQAGDITEAELMLLFAGDLASVLRARGYSVALTRDMDVYVPLETRVSLAREAGADLFLSLHADALAEGRASGATVYTLSAEAQAAASRTLAQRHARDDLLAGVDLSHHDDEVAQVLMSLARAETQPRADRLADAIVDHLGQATGNLHKRPRLSAAFSVLKAADIPSVLVELGFLSNEYDRMMLQDSEWRGVAAMRFPMRSMHGGPRTSLPRNWRANSDARAGADVAPVF